jgi:hypothetical protein
MAASSNRAGNPYAGRRSVCFVSRYATRPRRYYRRRCHSRICGNVLLFSRNTSVRRTGHVQCRERLGGLLRYYHQEAA